MLKIRLQKTGKKNQPSYRIVVKEARSKRDGNYMDIVGFYRPLMAKLQVKIDQKKYINWLNKGAQPTQTVRQLFHKLYGKTN